MRELAPAAEVRESESLPELAARINAAHAAGEKASWKGLDHFRQAGEALIHAKQRCGHGKWLKWLEKNVEFSQSMASKYMRLAKLEVTSNLEDAWRSLCGNDDAPEKTAHVSHNSGENEWYTPPQFLEAARKVMGAIDLDPASSKVAQKTVQADEFFTRDDDGLAKDWRGKVWLNPPYTSDLVEKFADKLCRHVEAGEVTQAVLMVNNATETKWFQAAGKIAAAICFPESRVKFLDKTGEPTGSPLQGQSFLYFGDDVESFAATFQEFGNCVRTIK